MISRAELKDRPSCQSCGRKAKHLLHLEQDGLRLEVCRQCHYRNGLYRRDAHAYRC